MSFACGAEPGPGEAQGARAPLVEVASVAEADRTYIIVADGFLEPIERVTLMAEVSGVVEWVADDLRPGGRFDARETMVRIESRVYDAERDRAAAEIDGARASRREAAASLERLKRLEGTGAAAEEQRETAEAALERAVAEVAAAEARFALADERVADTQIAAPFDAGVLSESAAPGRYVAPGAALAEVFDRSAAYVVVGVPIAATTDFRRRMEAAEGPLEVEVRREGPGGPVREGHIEAVEPAVDRRSRTLNVRVRVDDAFDAGAGDPFLVGEFVEVALPAKSGRTTFEVPAEAVRRDGHVFVVDGDSVLRRRAVDVLDRRDGLATVATDAALAGARVLLTALPEEADGLRVRLAGGAGGDGGAGERAADPASDRGAE